MMRCILATVGRFLLPKLLLDVSNAYQMIFTLLIIRIMLSGDVTSSTRLKSIFGHS